VFVFESPYEPDNEEMSEHLSRHGDGVRDVAFNVEDIDTIVKVKKTRQMLFLCSKNRNSSVSRISVL